MQKNDYEDLLGEFLGNRFQEFMDGLDKKPVKGAVFQRESITFDDIHDCFPEASLLENGYVTYPYGTIVGNGPFYSSGAIYPLDHSSFSVGRNLSLATSKGLKVIDLCAAPGGKSISYSFLNKPSFLIANDISSKRADIMRVNFERAGIEDCVITSVDPESFLDDFEGFFDVVILDAPCSGSGMTRKDDKMADDWSVNKVEKLVPVQKKLISIAYKLLRKGGILSYSTCSYSKEEDEDIVKHLISHFSASLIPVADDYSMEGFEGIGRRYISGFSIGEGQYHCLIKKEEETVLNELILPRHSKESDIFKGYRSISFMGHSRIFKQIDERALKYHPLKVGFTVDDTAQYAKCEYDWDLCHLRNHFPVIELTHSQALSFIRGEDLRTDTSSVEGKLVVATFKKMPLAFAKGIKGRLRNYLPKGLRVR